MKKKKNTTPNHRKRSKSTGSKRHLSRTQSKSNFPFELLQLIIRMAHPISVSIWEDLGSRTQEEHPNKNRLEKILTLSLVSRFWRRAIVNDPTTWSVINLPSPRALLQEQVSRSGRAPLHIFVHPRLWKSNEDISKYTIVFNEISRVKTLSTLYGFWGIFFAQTFSSSLLSVIPNQCARMLEILDIQGCGFPNGFQLLPSGAPQLKELFIGPGLFSLPLSFFGRLTTLTTSIYGLPSPKMFIDILLAAPLLEFLTLRYCGGDFHCEDPRLVQLSNLKKFTFYGGNSFLSEFLPLFIVPPNISWQIDIRNYTISSRSLTSIMSVAAPTDLHIDVSPYNSSISLHQSSYNTSFGLSCNRIKISLLANGVVASINAILPTLDLSKVTHIQLFSVPFGAIPEKLATRDIYRALVNLRKLTIYHGDNTPKEKGAKFENAYLLGLMCRVKPNGRGGAVPCPLLEELSITKPRVSLRGYATYLKTCIKARRTAGYPFKRVMLRNVVQAEITPNVRAVLRGLVEWM